MKTLSDDFSKIDGFIRGMNSMISVERDYNEYLKSRAYLTVDEAAIYLRISKNTLYKLTSNRLIPYSKLGRRLIFIRLELDEYIKSSKVNTQSESRRLALKFVSKS
jgi:excisionase family DNA binding protein